MSSIDISSLTTPKALQPTIKRVAQYVDTMASMGKRPDSVTLTRQQYDAIREVADRIEKARDPNYTKGSARLDFRGIPVARAA